MLSARKYMNSDADRLFEIQSACYKSYTGCFLSDVKHWKSAFPENPNIGGNRIIVATENNIPAGFAAYSESLHPFFPKNDYGCLIYDLCAVSDMKVYRHLVCTFMKEAESSGFNSIYSIIPRSNRKTMHALCQSGFTFTSEKFGATLSLINVGSFIKKQENRLEKIVPLDYPVNFEIFQDFSKGAVIANGGEDIRFTLFGKNTGKKVISIRCGISIISDILFGGYPLYKAILKSNISIKPYSHIPDAAAIFRACAIPGPWAIPLVNWR
jgi:hypothetical protein